jgi:glycerol-3-phosphate dehydrogenase
MFVFPWQGVTVVGTTDLDHDQPLDEEPGISPGEVTYLFEAIEARFPDLGLGLDDVVSTYAGVRPVVRSGKGDPSSETRDHVVWEEEGLITVTGGKLTTFRIIAHDAMETIMKRLPDGVRAAKATTILDESEPDQPGLERLDEADRKWIWGRHGARASEVVAAASEGELEHIGETPFLWAELRWAAREEWVCRLDDLLLRRLRIGMLVPDACAAHRERIGLICREELGWDEGRWSEEWAGWVALWRRSYHLPNRARIADWRASTKPAG